MVTQSGSAFIATALGELSDSLNGRAGAALSNLPISVAAQYRRAVARRNAAGGRVADTPARGRRVRAGRNVSASGAGSQSCSAKQRRRLGGLGRIERADDAVVSRGPDASTGVSASRATHHHRRLELTCGYTAACVDKASAVHGHRLQGVRAFDMIDRAGQHDHLRHPLAAVGAVEVLATRRRKSAAVPT